MFRPTGAFKRDLAQAQLTYAQFLKASAFFQKRHVDFNYVSGKGFRFERWTADGLPRMLILWCGPGATREWLDAPSQLFAELDRIEKQETAWHFVPTPEQVAHAKV